MLLHMMRERRSVRVAEASSRGAVAVVPHAARRSVAVVVFVSSVVVAVLGARYAGVDGPGRWDALGMTVVDRGLAPYSGDLRAAARLLSPTVAGAAALLVAGIAVITRRPRLAIVALVGAAMTGTATTVLQKLVDRRLNGTEALPSGHTAAATALAVAVVLLWVSAARRRAGLVTALGVAAVLLTGTAMSTALVAGGLHVPTDTVAGFCTGLSAVLGVALVVDRVAELPRNRRCDRLPIETPDRRGTRCSSPPGPRHDRVNDCDSPASQQ